MPRNRSLNNHLLLLLWLLALVFRMSDLVQLVLLALQALLEELLQWWMLCSLSNRFSPFSCLSHRATLQLLLFLLLLLLQRLLRMSTPR